MTHGFDRHYWDEHWRDRTEGPGSMALAPPNPHLVRELAGLAPGTALDAGCGAGAEALWLAEHGWQVTAADISAAALAHAAERAATEPAAVRVRWVEADLGTWEPGTAFDLVTTHYAHPAGPQLAFYDRLASWVAPGGTLLVVGHRHTQAHGHGHGDGPPAEASVTAAAVTARLDREEWTVVTADERQRSVPGPHGARQLDDVVVRATRRG